MVFVEGDFVDPPPPRVITSNPEFESPLLSPFEGGISFFKQLVSWKIDMEPTSVGLEDDSPFQFGWILGFYVNLRGCYPMIIKERKSKCFSLFLQIFVSLQLCT